ncbi:MAG: hypothetical protein ACI4QW_02390 [Clostridia bacterium]
MLTIKKIEDMQEIGEYLTKNGLALSNAPQQYMGVYAENGLCALGSLTLCGAKVYMNFIHEEGGGHLDYGLAKALLNMADLRGIKTVYGSNTDLDKLYTVLRFTKENHEFVLSLDVYFTAEGLH